MRGLLLLLVGWLAFSAAARAEAAVVLFERAPLRPGLCAALRIQLSGSGEVRCVADGTAPGLAERLESARDRLRSDAAKLGVLLERDADPHLVRMYLVSPDGEQAALSIERIEDRPEPDVDRSLALKVRDAYELIGFVQRELPKREPTAAVLARPPPAAPAPSVAIAAPPPAPEPYVHAFVELGGGIALGGNLRGLGNALLGVGAVSTRMRYEFGLGGRLSKRESSPRNIAGARVHLSERGPLLAMRLTYRMARVELGAALQLFLAFTAAEAEAAGIRGRESTITPVIGVAPDLRLRLFPLAYLRLAPSFEFATVRQRYVVNELLVIERKYFGASLTLALVISLPVQPTRQGFQP